MNLIKKIFCKCDGNLPISNVSESDKLLTKLFEHITKPSEEWPQTIIGKRIDGKTTWYNGGVDDEFRDYLVAVEKYLHSH